MPNYGVTMRDANDYGSPKWPWILLALIVVAAGTFLYLRNRDSKDNEITETTSESKVEATSDSAIVPQIPATVAPMSAEAKQKLDEAFRMADDGALAEARAALLDLLEDPSTTEVSKRIESRLGEIDVELVTTPHAMPEKVDYAIAAGDQIRAIARKFGTTRDLICKSNNVRNPDKIQVGDRLRVLNNASFAIHVSKTTNELLLTMNGKFFKRYVVSTGKYGRTPVGTFKITVKEVEPIWYIDGRQIPYGDKENILGTRWMAIEATGDTMPASGYGIHGTWEPESLGKQASAGCVRMRNEDVEELFLIVPEGTPVTIVE